MEELPIEFLIFLIIMSVYLPLAYLFLGPGLFAFIFKHHEPVEKFFEIVGFVLLPFLIPVGIVLWVGWWLFKAVFAIFLIIFLIISSPLYILTVRLPFGGVFKTWVKISSRILDWTRTTLEVLTGYSPDRPVRSPEENIKT